MRTLHTGLRVTDPAISLAFYSALGYTVIGRVAGQPSSGHDAQGLRALAGIVDPVLAR
jgi:catechol 2,3-dioxygenase-like lactoylglutathione lyase family enzyme